MSENLLQVSGLSVRFGGIVALNNVSFDVKRSSITALIGPNGAGKTTVFNCLTGFYRASAGKILLQRPNETPLELGKLLGEAYSWSDVAQPWNAALKLRYKMFGGSHLLAQRGIARTFQNIRLFQEMTVYENLLVAQHARVNRNVFSGVLQTPRFRKAEHDALERADFWLKVVDLEGHGNRIAASLPYGHQRRLEIARAMCINPQLICLDEPAAGLNPRETLDLAALIKRLRQEFNVTVFVIEHDMGLVMEISDHVVVLNYGQVIAADRPAVVKKDPLVLSAYLGTEGED